jgi:hypothetical protein
VPGQDKKPSSLPPSESGQAEVTAGQAGKKWPVDGSGGKRKQEKCQIGKYRKKNVEQENKRDIFFSMFFLSIFSYSTFFFYVFSTKLVFHYLND